MTDPSAQPTPRIQPVWLRVVVSLGLQLLVSGLVSGGLVALAYLPRFIPQGNPETWSGMQIDPALFEEILMEPMAQWLLLFGAALGTLAVLWGMRKIVDRKSLGSLGLFAPGSPWPAAAWGGFFGGLLAGVSVLLIAAIGGRHLRVVAFDGSVGLGLAFLFVVTFVALAEELFFRGYVFVNLKEDGGRLPAVLWSSVFFSGLHMGNPAAGFLGMLNVFLMGGILGILRDMTGSVAAGVGLHAAWNIMLGVILGSQVSGFTMPSALRVRLEGLSPLLGGSGFGPEGSLVVTIILLGAGSWLLYRYLKYLSISLGGDRDSR